MIARLARYSLAVAAVLLPTLLPADGAIVALTNAHIIPMAGDEIAEGTILIKDGLIDAIGANSAVTVPSDATVIDAKGKFIMPGIIDTHSHMGVYSWPGVEANSDGNEATGPITAQVRAEDAINLDDPAFERARAGGVTSCLIIPGSANMIGGEGIVVKLRPNQLVSGMRMKEAPRQLKMAMGENPKRVYGGKGQMPSTRMGIVAKHREVWTKAKEYAAKKVRYEEKLAKYEEKHRKYDEDVKAGKEVDDEPEKPDPIERDPLNEVLADVLAGKVRVQVHCYRKDDIMDIIRIADEFGFKIAAFHHVLEGYKVPEELVKRGIGASTWPDWWGFKMEAYDATPANMAIMANAGVVVATQSDSANIGQRLYHEAAKAMKYGMTRQQALATLNINGAKILGTDKWVGSLEKGKQADIVVMSADPFDMYSLVEQTYIDGVKVFDRSEYNQKIELNVFSKYSAKASQGTTTTQGAAK